MCSMYMLVRSSVWQVQSFEKSPSGQGIYRAAMVVAFAAFVYWAYSQPTEFDSLITAQKQFMHDLYEGNLLADVAQVRGA